MAGSVPPSGTWLSQAPGRGKLRAPGGHMNDIGIAGWALNRSIREHKTVTLLQFPAIARDEFGVDTVELVSTFFESQSAKYLNELRQALEKERLTVHNIAVDTGN